MSRKRRGASSIKAGLACKDTQFMIIEGVAATPDGTLIIADGRGGALLELSDPGLPTCQSHYVAGTHEKFLDSDVGPGNAANPGDIDGKGVDTKFLGVSRPVVAPNGNVFVYDEGNSKLTKIATDKDRTVSTVAEFRDNIFALAYLNGKVYASGSDGAHDLLLAIGTDGAVLATLAGSGAAIDWPADFDPTRPHAAQDWVLVNADSGEQWLTLDQGKLYWAGGVGVARTMLQFSCP